jgi:protein gp37
MSKTTKIQWCHHTFNPWRGCQKVSPGCEHCYAEDLSKRNPAVLGEWGPNGKRAMASEAYWRQPLLWAREAREAGERRRVFCASLSDVFEDRPELDGPRHRLFDLILATPDLDWLLLTKRPGAAKGWLTGTGMFRAGLSHAWGDGWPNVWLGVSVEDKRRARERIPLLLEIPNALPWVSAEPLLEDVDFGDFVHELHGNGIPKPWGAGVRVGWIVVGGESGPHARPFDLSWARRVIRDCRGAAAIFIKQLGAKPVHTFMTGWGERPEAAPRIIEDASVKLRDSHGGDPEEWPEDLRIRDFPRPRKEVVGA